MPYQRTKETIIIGVRVHVQI